MELSNEAEILLNRILPQLSNWYYLSVTDIANPLAEISDIIELLAVKNNLVATPIELEVTNFLLEERFATPIIDDKGIPMPANVLSRGSWAREIKLSLKGDQLKAVGSIKEYYRQINHEEHRRSLLDQTVLRTYWINLCIALATGMAAVYYFFQLYDGGSKAHPCVALWLLGLAIATVTLSVVLRGRTKNKTK